jgi:hypothetical protein
MITSEAFVLTVYDLSKDWARVQSKTRLTVPKADALKALKIIRQALPSHCGASLTDSAGRNVRL